MIRSKLCYYRAQNYLEKFRNCRKAKEKGEMLPKLKKGKPRSLPGVVCSIYLQYMTLPF